MAQVAPSWLSHASRLVLAISLAGNLAYLLIPWTKLLELCPTYKCVGTMGIFRLPVELTPQDPDYEWLVRVLVGLLALLVGNEALKKWYKLAVFPQAANQLGAANFYNRGIALTVVFGILVLLLPCLGGSTGELGSCLALAAHSWAAPRVVAIVVAWIASETVIGWYKMLR